MDINSALLSIFKDNFPKNEVNEDFSKNSCQEWDSITNLFIYNDINKKFNLTLDTNEYLKCKNFNDIVLLIKKYDN